MIIIIPAIIVIVKVVTKIRRNLILAGSSSDVLLMNSGSHLVEVKIIDGSNKRLDKALSAFAPESLNLSRSYATRLIQNGAVSLHGAIIREADYKVLVGQVWSLIIPEATRLDAVPQNIPLDVIFEDEFLISIYGNV